MINETEIESILELIDICFNETKHLQYLSDYKTLLLNYLEELLIYEEDDISDIIELQLDYYFYVNDIPEYSLYNYEIYDKDYNIYNNDDKITNTINELIKIPIIKQRTNEWLEIRYNMLSASNIYRAFKSPITIKSLIRDKSIPLSESNNYNAKINLHNSLGWGILFEKVSVNIYEYIYKTKIGLFGCIKHKNFDFIGASPDGINISKGDRFGRMLEIKNIYNRDITGIPSDEYWTQMQIQMEVCNLPLCDFLETRFCLYESVDKFIQDNNNDFRGVFIEKEGKYNYYYLWDHNGNIEEFLLLINNKEGNIYWWYLDEFSCVLVKRNKLWFDSIYPFLNDTWNKILEERKNININQYKKNICLIKLE